MTRTSGSQCLQVERSVALESTRARRARVIGESINRLRDSLPGGAVELAQRAAAFGRTVTV